jgi:signal transduction histidine kinase
MTVRMPHMTMRMRLTALYGAVFLASGTVLLAITYALVAHRLPSSAVYVRSSGVASGSQTVVAGEPQTIGGAPIQAPLSPAQAEALFHQVQAAAARQRADALHQLVVESGVALAIMAVASMGLGWLLAGRALRPLRAMTLAARQLSEDNLHERLPADGPPDELGDLATTFNALLGRLEGAFESQRQFVAHASHELRTPLTLERAILEVTLADPDADVTTLRSACERVLAIGAQQEALIEALLTLARSQRGLDEYRPVDVAAATAEALSAGRAASAARAVTIEADLGPAWAAGDQRLVERLASNLVDNAVRYNHDGGTVGVRTGTVDGHAVLSVTNTGPPVAGGEIERLFQPFQRLDTGRAASADGLGLGLSIVAAIASAHGAALAAGPAPAGGLRVDVRFPLAIAD